MFDLTFRLYISLFLSIIKKYIYLNREREREKKIKMVSSSKFQILLGFFLLARTESLFYNVQARPHESAITVRSDAGIESGELLLVQALFRHGDRTPISLYTNDPYNNYSWNEGLGELTLVGKERMYNYGQVLRKRYEDYLSKCFDALMNHNMYLSISQH